MLEGKKILLGVCGSIAAYKAAVLIRLLKKEGAEVKVIMTASALDFITPLTLATLSKNPVLGAFHDEKTGEWESHVELGLWADIFLIAPASANTLGKMANGICDNLLLATYLSARCPVMIAPAMDLDMYRHQATKTNIEKVLSFGNHIVHAEHGELASGLVGEGRMAEPETILSRIKEHVKKKSSYQGKKVIITAGPTFESIDPVRFIGNHSSGKMGYALAEEFAARGAQVDLVSGPVNLNPGRSSIQLHRITSASEMLDVSRALFEKADITVFAAAVSDYRPAHVSKEKIKKSEDTLNLSLTKNPDIARELGRIKKPNQINIGFALETENELENASLKLKDKNFDFIVINSLKEEGAGFVHDTNKITILDSNGNIHKYELKSKDQVAIDIIDFLNAYKNE